MIGTPLTREMTRAGRSIAGLPDAPNPVRTDDVAECISCTHALMIVARMLPAEDPDRPMIEALYRASQVDLYNALRNRS